MIFRIQNVISTWSQQKCLESKSVSEWSKTSYSLIVYNVYNISSTMQDYDLHIFLFYLAWFRLLPQQESEHA